MKRQTTSNTTSEADQSPSKKPSKCCTGRDVVGHQLRLWRPERPLDRSSEWRTWGPYLAERHWGTVREDNSFTGNCWEYFPFDDAGSRAYVSGEDGLLGFCDHQGLLCVSLAMTNGKDPFLKERLFGLSSPEGNHGEDVKELYYHSYGTPCHSVMRALYRYPQKPFPYQQLREENMSRSSDDGEYEILDTGVFDGDDYWDVDVQFAKLSHLDVVCRYTFKNRSSEPAELWALPQVWFRNTWSLESDKSQVPQIKKTGCREVGLTHPDSRLGYHKMNFLDATDGNLQDVGFGPEILFTENETNRAQFCGGNIATTTSPLKPTKDLFNTYIKALTKGETVPIPSSGTKCAGCYHLKVQPGGTAVVRWQLSHEIAIVGFDWLSSEQVDRVIEERTKEADLLYKELLPDGLSEEESNIIRQAFAGLLWNKQFYCYNVKESLQRKEKFPKVLSHSSQLPAHEDYSDISSYQFSRGTKHATRQQTVQTMPATKNTNKKEAGIQAKSTVTPNNPTSGLDSVADNTEAVCSTEAGMLSEKGQTALVSDAESSESSGQCSGIKPSERNLEWDNLQNHDVISMPDKWEFPWYAAWDLAFHMVPFCRIDPEFAKQQLQLFLTERYMHSSGKIPAYEFNLSDVNPPVHAWGCWEVYLRTGRKDVAFLRGCFHKLLINYTWWLNQRKSELRFLFGGGFLGLDNISVIDRSNHVPKHGHLYQADGTGWVAFYSLTMLKISVELAQTDPLYADLIPRFLGDFLRISEALNATTEIGGLWDETDGFFYDVLQHKDEYQPIRVRSLVGIIPMLATCVISVKDLQNIVTEDKQNVLELFKAKMEAIGQFIQIRKDLVFLSAVDKIKLKQVLSYLSNTEEFLSPFGIRSLSKYYQDHPYSLEIDQTTYWLEFCPGESTSSMFGGNSNWRGPVWFPMNYLILQTLETAHRFYGDSFAWDSGIEIFTMDTFASSIRKRLISLFLPDVAGNRPCHGGQVHYRREGWTDKILFYEFFHSETGRGCGASHQTGWTALIIELILDSYRT